MVDAVATGTVEGQGSLEPVVAVRSDDFEEVYFIAAEIDGPEVEADGDVGVWASNSLQPGEGLIMSVNALAKEFSEWPAGDSTDANITTSDEGAAEAVACGE